MNNGQSIDFRPIVFSDFDGTITQVDVTDRILSEFAHPSWREVEKEWVSGRIGSRECLRRQMELVDASEWELDALIDSVPLDEHFPGFVRFARRTGVPFYVVSDGFDYVIRRALKRGGISGELRNGSHLFSSALALEARRTVATFPRPACEHGCATCKAEVIRRVGGKGGPGRGPIVFIGDGLSDRFAVQESDVVFAKGRLLEHCREEGIACIPFATFADVERELGGRRAAAETGPRQSTSEARALASASLRER